MTWIQRTKPNTRVTDGMGWCLRFTQSVFDAPVRYNSARQAWDHQKGRHVGKLPPEGLVVPIWLDHYGTYGTPPKYDNWGHVCVSLGDGRILTSPLLLKQLQANGKGQAVYPSLAAMIKDLGNGQYLGWSEYMNDKLIVENVPTAQPVPVNPSQKTVRKVKRTASTPSKVYELPTTKSRVVRTLGANRLATIAGWTRGAPVNGKVIWYKVAHGWTPKASFKTYQPELLKKLKEYR